MRDDSEIIDLWGNLTGNFTSASRDWDSPKGTPKGALQFWDAEDIWFEPSNLVGSSYSGGILAKANYDRMGEILAELEDKYGDDWWEEKRYAYGGRSYAFQVAETPTEVIEIIGALEDYPVLDEEFYSQAMFEAEQEAWDSWVKGDYRSALQRRFDDPDDALDEVSDEDLWEHFREAAEDANVYWQDSSEGIYIDVDRVAEAADEAPWD